MDPYLRERVQLKFSLGMMDKSKIGTYVPAIQLAETHEAKGFQLEFHYLRALSTIVKTRLEHVDLARHDPLQMLTFTAENADEFWFEIAIYSRSEGSGNTFEPMSSNDRSLLGKVLIHPDTFKQCRGTLSRPIIDQVSLQIIGTFNASFQVILPFLHPKNSLASWLECKRNAPISISSDTRCGHRGCGTDTQPRQAIEENTLLSFLIAAQYGAEYIELDTHLALDNTPIVYHDYDISITPQISMPIAQLTVDQFKSLKPKYERKGSPKSRRDSFKRTQSLDSFEYSNQKKVLIHEGFPTLAETLQRLPKSVGILVEIKYPSEAYTDSKRVAYPERNIVVDSVLKVVFDNDERENIVFQSFDPDICLLLSAKQARYPVFFLTHITPQIEPDNDYNIYDHRCLNFDNAIKFAENVQLRGISGVASSVTRDPSVVRNIKSKNLYLFTYGVPNDEGAAKTLKDLGVDGLIVDNIVGVGKALSKAKPKNGGL